MVSRKAAANRWHERSRGTPLELNFQQQALALSPTRTYRRNPTERRWARQQRTDAWREPRAAQTPLAHIEAVTSRCRGLEAVRPSAWLHSRFLACTGRHLQSVALISSTCVGGIALLGAPSPSACGLHAFLPYCVATALQEALGFFPKDCTLLIEAKQKSKLKISSLKDDRVSLSLFACICFLLNTLLSRSPRVFRQLAVRS